MIEARYAPLTAALVRGPAAPSLERPIRIEFSSTAAADARFFVLSWAAGFVFFLTFLI